MYKSLFLDAQNDDKKIILDYFNLLNGYILKKTDPHYPYIQGKFPKQLNSFLNEKELNLINNHRKMYYLKWQNILEEQLDGIILLL